MAMNDKGRIKGPMHLVARVLQSAEIEAPGPWEWDIPDWPGCDIRTLADFRGVALDIARRAAWIHLSKKRQGYAGCRQGVDHSATLKFQRRLNSSAQQEQMLSILCDGVWSQCRAAQKGVCDGKCLHCPHPEADSHHLWWECPGIQEIQKNNSEMRKRCRNFSHSNLSGNQYILGCFGLE